MGKGMKVTLNATAQDLTAELLDALASQALPTMEADEITAKMLADTGIGYQRATDLLKAKVASGEMTCRAVYSPDSQRKVIAYRKATTQKEP